mmetsp:Transcript_25901/g.59715  ORF Transcript_25901/g.59715 Transcript_25901/m.59715 type:complete len:213 (-) Transcript_25901:1123-1761(-)
MVLALLDEFPAQLVNFKLVVVGHASGLLVDLRLDLGVYAGELDQGEVLGVSLALEFLEDTGLVDVLRRQRLLGMPIAPLSWRNEGTFVLRQCPGQSLNLGLELRLRLGLLVTGISQLLLDLLQFVLCGAQRSLGLCEGRLGVCGSVQRLCHLLAVAEQLAALLLQEVQLLLALPDHLVRLREQPLRALQLVVQVGKLMRYNRGRLGGVDLRL